MLKKILIIHGWESNSKEHWFGEEKEILEKKGYKVSVPDMPNSFHPKEKEWVSVIKDFDPDENSILIGHSLGGTVILRYLEKGKRIHKCILIATPIKKLNLEPDSFLEQEFDWEVIRNNAEKFVILNQTKDQWVSKDHGEELSEHVQGELVIVDGDNHFDTIDFNLLNKYI